MMDKENTKIFIIDDDPSVCRSISLLLATAGYSSEFFHSAEDFLELETYQVPGCVLLDIFLEGKSGLELQDEISNKFAHLPIIYITGRGDIPMSVTAIRKGAINFLQKPIADHQLLDAIAEALQQSQQFIYSEHEITRIKSLIDTLTPRELEIYECLITGMLNKQIARQLNIAEHTVKIHRGNITKKLGMKSVAEMVHLSEKLKIG